MLESSVLPFPWIPEEGLERLMDGGVEGVDASSAGGEEGDVQEEGGESEEGESFESDKPLEPADVEEAEDEVPIAVLVKKKPAMAVPMAMPAAGPKKGTGKAQKGGKGGRIKADKGKAKKGDKGSKVEVATKGGKGDGVQQDGEAGKLLVLLISWSTC